METLGASIQNPERPLSSQTHFPARGWKRDPGSGALCVKNLLSKLISPQGDGNKILCYTLIADKIDETAFFILLIL